MGSEGILVEIGVVILMISATRRGLVWIETKA